MTVRDQAAVATRTRTRRYRMRLVGDAGAVFPPFTGSGVLKAVANATSLVDALADTSTVDDALRRWSEAQLQVAAQVMPIAERTERSHVFDMPDLTTMPTTATNDWMSSAYPGFVVTLPDVTGRRQAQSPSPLHSGRRGGAERSISRYTSGGQCSGGHAGFGDL
jgi:hypothetical protein